MDVVNTVRKFANPRRSSVESISMFLCFPSNYQIFFPTSQQTNHTIESHVMIQRNTQSKTDTPLNRLCAATDALCDGTCFFFFFIYKINTNMYLNLELKYSWYLGNWLLWIPCIFVYQKVMFDFLVDIFPLSLARSMWICVS